MGLVDYVSDSESDPESTRKSVIPLAVESEPLAKRRKVLPPIPSNYVVDPGDDPALHQGRTRTRPFIPGELNAHIYLSLKAPRSLRTTIGDLVARAQSQVADRTLHSLLETPTPSQKAGELHISITHPLPLRKSQVDPLRIELSTGLKEWARTRGLVDLKCSLAGTPSVYYNGKATGGEGKGGRAFLALRVGAGAAELNSIVEKVIHPILDRYHLPLYHTNPEYHASFAWCLLDPRTDKPAVILVAEEAEETQSTEKGHNEIVLFSDELIKTLGTEFGPRLLEKQPSGGWQIEHLVLRAGKAIHEIPLA